MAKKITTILLVLLMLLPLMAGKLATPVSAAQSDMQSSIEDQIRAYATSIDMPNADDDAARVIAMHGVMMGGRDMEADENHALTATLWNSEFALNTLINSCEAIIRQMQITGASQLYAGGYVEWREEKYARGVSVDYLSAYASDASFARYGIETPYRYSEYYGTTNAYDATMIWIGGTLSLKITVTRAAVSNNQTTYNIEVSFFDRFDFDPNSAASVPNTIASLLASAMFREFDWYSTVEFELTVPYSCDHTAGVYHWSLDGDTGALEADTSGVFTENGAEMEENSKGIYYKLDKTLRLYHDQPWVLEYSVRGEDTLIFSAAKQSDNSFPMLLFSGGGTYFHVGMYDKKPDGSAPWDLYGVNSIGINSDHIHTYRLENVLKSDGSNMIYLTVYDQTAQKLLVDAAPLNNYFTGTDEEITDKKKTNNWVDGEDIYINYIGTKDFPLNADTFELTIYENGKDSNFISTETVKPTCTTPGGVKHSCAACGYSYYTDETPAHGHDWGSYKSNNDATCQHDGTKTATCKTCGETKTVTDEGTKKGHDWSGATCLYPKTCLTCGETTGEYGGHDWEEASCFKAKTCKLCGETEGEPLPHEWKEATCDRAKYCIHCGVSEGEPLGHIWSGVTCEHANTCLVCGKVVGEPKEHTWVDATCTRAKHCAFCNLEQGEPAGHEWAGGSCTEAPTCKNCGRAGTPYGHKWAGGSCQEKQHCERCDALGDYLDHDWTAAGCDAPRSCRVCGYGDGEALGHDWADADCTHARTCQRCDLTEGDPLGHDWQAATCLTPMTCSRCALTLGALADHTWLPATCHSPEICSCCALTRGDALSHAWADATCHAPKTCTLCGETAGENLQHIWTAGTCTQAPSCTLCAEERQASGHAWLNPDCDHARICGLCGQQEGSPLGHPDSNEDGVCDRCGTETGTPVVIEPETVVDWWPIAAAAALVLLGVADVIILMDYRKAKAGYYE